MQVGAAPGGAVAGTEAGASFRRSRRGGFYLKFLQKRGLCGGGPVSEATLGRGAT